MILTSNHIDTIRIGNIKLMRVDEKTLCFDTITSPIDCLFIEVENYGFDDGKVYRLEFSMTYDEGNGEEPVTFESKEVKTHIEGMIEGYLEETEEVKATQQDYHGTPYRYGN